MFLVFLAPRERKALEFLVFKEPMVLLDQWAQLVCLANLELVSLVPLAILVNQANLACQEEMVPQAQWVHKDQRVTLVLQAKEHQENQVRMVPQVCLDLWELKVHRVQLASQVPLVCQVLVKLVSLESQVAEVPLVLQEPQVRRENLVLLVSLVSQVLLVKLAQLVHKVPEDSRVRQAQQDQKVTSAWLVHQDLGEPRVNRELRDSQENQVLQGL